MWESAYLREQSTAGADLNRRPSMPSVRLRRISIVLGVLAAMTAVPGPTTALAATARQAERLDRGLISVRSGSGSSAGNLVSWRLLGTEAADTGFNVYRGSTRVNASPITTATD